MSTKDVKARYEKQLQELRTELKSLKMAKKEHSKAMKKNVRECVCVCVCTYALILTFSCVCPNVIGSPLHFLVLHSLPPSLSLSLPTVTGTK